jgi:hypothetical protein
MGWISNKFLGFLETYGGKMSCWAWNKRWNKRTYVPWISKKTGKVYTINKKTGEYKK